MELDWQEISLEDTAFALSDIGCTSQPYALLSPGQLIRLKSVYTLS